MLQFYACHCIGSKAHVKITNHSTEVSANEDDSDSSDEGIPCKRECGGK